MMAVAILAFTFTGCSDEATPESDDKILKPVAGECMTVVSMKESYKKLDGKWVEDPIPEGQGQTYTIRTDGTVLSAFTAPDGYTEAQPGRMGKQTKPPTN